MKGLGGGCSLFVPAIFGLPFYGIWRCFPPHRYHYYSFKQAALPKKLSVDAFSQRRRMYLVINKKLASFSRHQPFLAQPLRYQISNTQKQAGRRSFVCSKVGRILRVEGCWPHHVSFRPQGILDGEYCGFGRNGGKGLRRLANDRMDGIH
ncbi:hypothetical protein BJ508DRAFT_20817 [Ascobolus immersus RN42]|uniref:Uncharacterized protein n=1 Tax=Ascobolus immersus RN42 TaxID=1160509 RepID=A0A3N4IFQ2_ASCIM|nr:hypothetical protein BJ508DRAFT_20817 [Ascobolus immersus RN42]